MSVEHNSENDVPTFKQFRLTISNDVLVQAIENHQRETGKSEKEIAKDAIIDYLEEENQIILQ